VKKVVSVLCIVAATAAAASAGEIAVGPHLGLTFGGDVEESSFAFGAQGIYRLSEDWSLELAISKFTDEQEESERWAGGGAIWMADYDIIPITLTALCNIPVQEGLAVYFGGGVAVYLIDVEASARPLPGTATTAVSQDIDTDLGLGVQGVAGCTYDITDALCLFAELRMALSVYYYDATYAGVDGGSAWTETEDDTDDYSYGMLRLGASYRF